MPRSFIVALTGGIASGKSTVGRWLRELGCTVADADSLVAELYRPGAVGAAAVRDLFGEGFLDSAGAVLHPKLADLVFNNTAALRRLEAAIHPLVGKAFQDLVASSDGIVIFEVPLLAETSGKSRYDAVVTVEADPELRIARAIERGVDPDSARARLEAQADSATRIALADYVLHNEGSLDELRKQVEELVAKLNKRLEGS